MDLVKKLVEYTSKKDNQKHTAYNFYLKDKEGGLIAIKPAFANDYNVLKYLATAEVKK